VTRLLSRRTLVWVLAFVVLAMHIAYYYPFIADDSFISLRYASRLIAGKGLTWNDGEWWRGIPTCSGCC